MNLPGAQITHQIRNRIRIRIPEKRGDISYFQTLAQMLDSELKDLEVQIAPVTGSLVVQGPSPDPARVFALAESKGLFVRAAGPKTKTNTIPLVPALVKQAVSQFNAGIRMVTGNQMDMASTAFVLLIVHAAREIMKENLAAPSWFTALWVASNIYSSNLKGAGTDSLAGTKTDTGPGDVDSGSDG